MPLSWACQLRSISAVLGILSAILECLSAIRSPIVVGLRAKLHMFSVVYALLMFQSLLSTTKRLHKLLQKETVDLAGTWLCSPSMFKVHYIPGRDNASADYLSLCLSIYLSIYSWSAWSLNFWGRSISQLHWLETAHRTLTFHQEGRSSPRPILIKLLHFQDELKILLVHEKKELSLNGSRMLIYPTTVPTW